MKKSHEELANMLKAELIARGIDAEAIDVDVSNSWSSGENRSAYLTVGHLDDDRTGIEYELCSVRFADHELQRGCDLSVRTDRAVVDLQRLAEKVVAIAESNEQ